MRFLLPVLFLLVFTSSLLAQPLRNQPDPFRKFPVKALQADFRLMRRALEEVHPSLYWYMPKDTLDAVFDRALRAIDHPLTEQEFINLLYLAICQIRCGHTQLEHSTAYAQLPNLNWPCLTRKSGCNCPGCGWYLPRITPLMVTA